MTAPSMYDLIRWAKNVSTMLRQDGKPDQVAHHVLLVLATYADPDGSNARPSVATLARETRLADETARKALLRIESAGLIVRTGTAQQVTVWRLRLDIRTAGVEELDRQRQQRREKNAERQRRFRQRHSVTPPEGVTPEPRNGVEGRYITPSRPLRNGGEGRYVTAPEGENLSLDLPRPTNDQPPLSPPRGESAPKARKRGTHIPDDFTVTPDMVEWAREKTPLVGRTETEAFVDHWLAADGSNAIKRDWVAAWRNWMRRAQADAERRMPRSQPPPGAPQQGSTGSKRVDKALGFLAPNDPLREQLGLTPPALSLVQPPAIEGGLTA